jgi:hypothetical protein
VLDSTVANVEIAVRTTKSGGRESGRGMSSISTPSTSGTGAGMSPAGLPPPKQIRFVNNEGQPPPKRRRINAA